MSGSLPIPDATPSRRILSPVERVSEVLFGLIMALTFTGSISVAEHGREEIRELLIGALGCNIAWGLVDAVMYIVNTLVERAREERQGALARGRLTGRDFLGALGVFLLVSVTTLPLVVPFLVFDEALYALRISNAIALVMLFVCGWSLGRYAGLRPLRMALGMLAVGLALVAATIALGG